MSDGIVDRQIRPAVWRRTDEALWLARRDGRHLGAVERRSRHAWVACDADSRTIGVHRTLLQAQGAVLGPASATAVPALANPAAWEPLLLVGVCSAAAMALLAPFWLLSL